MQYASKNTDETLRTNACNIRVQLLQHMKHPNPLCNIHLRHLQYISETSETLETYACNMHVSIFFFRTTQSRAANDRFRPAGRLRMVVRPGQQRPPLLVAWPHTASECLRGHCWVGPASQQHRARGQTPASARRLASSLEAAVTSR